MRYDCLFLIIDLLSWCILLTYFNASLLISRYLFPSRNCPSCSEASTLTSTPVHKPNLRRRVGKHRHQWTASRPFLHRLPPIEPQRQIDNHFPAGHRNLRATRQQIERARGSSESRRGCAAPGNCCAQENNVHSDDGAVERELQDRVRTGRGGLERTEEL